jgi:hypothetical protein
MNVMHITRVQFEQLIAKYFEEKAKLLQDLSDRNRLECEVLTYNF